MSLGVDTNVLVRAMVPSLPGHKVIRQNLERILSAETVVVLTPAILHELLHVITDGRRFENPVPMLEAVALCRYFVGRSNAELVATDEVASMQALDWIEEFGLGRKRLADTLFAATLRNRGVSQVLTLNARDFQIFPDLEVVDPREG